MNEIIRTYLRKLEKSADEIEKVLQNYQTHLENQKDAYERLTQQYWSRGKELSVLSDASNRLDAVNRENEQLRSVQQQVRESLQRLRDYVKDLSEAVRQ